MGMRVTYAPEAIAWFQLRDRPGMYWIAVTMLLISLASSSLCSARVSDGVDRGAETSARLVPRYRRDASQARRHVIIRLWLRWWARSTRPS